jgi:hypothetical protein
MEGAWLGVSGHSLIGHQAVRLAHTLAIEFLFVAPMKASDARPPRMTKNLTVKKHVGNMTPMRSIEYSSHRAACCRSHNAML